MESTDVICRDVFKTRGATLKTTKHVRPYPVDKLLDFRLLTMCVFWGTTNNIILNPSLFLRRHK